MKKTIIFSTLFVLVSTLSYGQNNHDSLFTTLGYSTQIESKYLNQTKTLYIHLPFKFDKDKEYPLIIVADFMAFKPLSSTTEIMAYNQTIPWCIVVCPVVTNVTDEYSPVLDENSEKASGGKTISFYEKELFPFLQSKYKISKKILWGKGYSGMFSTFVMLSKPGLFDGYISDTPKLELIEKINTENVFDKMADTKVFYYLAGSSAKEKDKTTRLFVENITKEQKSGFKWNYVENDDSVFISRILTNYTHGLVFLFNSMND
jgi:predicted alpha/beta superfamily hydrolase